MKDFYKQLLAFRVATNSVGGHSFPGAFCAGVSNPGRSAGIKGICGERRQWLRMPSLVGSLPGFN